MDRDRDRGVKHFKFYRANDIVRLLRRLGLADLSSAVIADELDSLRSTPNDLSPLPLGVKLGNLNFFIDDCSES